MKTTYKLVATVERTVEDTIELDVVAIDELEAFSIAQKALEKYPNPQPEESVTYCWTAARVQTDDDVDIIDLRLRPEEVE